MGSTGYAVLLVRVDTQVPRVRGTSPRRAPDFRPCECLALQRVPPHILSSQPDVARDLVGGEVHRLRNGLALEPCEVPWLDCRMA